MRTPKKPTEPKSKRPTKTKTSVPATNETAKPKRPLTRRPWSLTPERLDKLKQIANPDNQTEDELIIRGLSAGLPTKYAFQLAGIDPKAYAEWVKRTEDPDQLEKYPELKDFHQIAQQIEARTYLYHLENLKALASGEKGKGWFAASAWYLERRLPEYFALKRETTKTETTVDVKIVAREAEDRAREYMRLKRLDHVQDAEIIRDETEPE